MTVSQIVAAVGLALFLASVAYAWGRHDGIEAMRQAAIEAKLRDEDIAGLEVK